MAQVVDANPCTYCGSMVHSLKLLFPGSPDFDRKDCEQHRACMKASCITHKVSFFLILF